jgi:carboxypeptidase family protein
MRILTVLLASTLLAAQTSTTGSLAGVVVDPTGALIPAAHLILKDNAKGTIQEVDSDAEGSYLVPFLAPANYTVTVSHVGFKTGSYSVTVSLGPPTTLIGE